MTRAWRVIGALAALVLLLGVIGLVLSNLWYHDDACMIELWQCKFGSLGFTLAFFMLPIGAGLALLFVVGAVLAQLRRHRENGEPN